MLRTIIALSFLAALANAVTTAAPATTAAGATTTAAPAGTTAATTYPCNTATYTPASGVICAAGTVSTCGTTAGIIGYLNGLTTTVQTALGIASCKVIDTASTSTSKWVDPNTWCPTSQYSGCSGTSCTPTTVVTTTSVSTTTVPPTTAAPVCCCSTLNSVASQWCSGITSANQLAAGSAATLFTSYNTALSTTGNAYSGSWPGVTTCSTATTCLSTGFCAGSSSASTIAYSAIAMLLAALVSFVTLA